MTDRSARNAARGPLRTLRTALSAYALGCFLIPVLPGGGLAALVVHVPGGGAVAAAAAAALQSALGKFVLFALVYSWNGFCLGGMVALPVPPLARRRPPPPP
jgi:hypothetical protein